MTPATPWHLRPAAPETYVESLAGSFSPEVIQLLWNRKVEAADAAIFTGRRKHDPFAGVSLAGLAEAAATIERTIQAGDLIVIHGDYDADGVTGAAVLADVLEELGADFKTFLPSRGEQGYDLSAATVERFQSEGAKLFVTVDCGVTATSAIDRSHELGVEVIVTDHHLPGPAGLPADVTVNPMCEPEGRCSQLSGSGVAYLLARYLRSRAGLDPDAGLDLAAIGTVADVMPLTGINRDIVLLGMEQIRRNPRAGVAALCHSSKVSEISSQSIAFSIVPRINAAGRLRSPDPAFHLLRTKDPVEAGRLAEELDKLNLERQRKSAELLKLARAQLVSEVLDVGPLLIRMSSPETGLYGLVAGQLARELNRQVFVVDGTAAIGTGSARSGNGSSVHGTLQQSADLLHRFGGHAVAAGFSVARENLDALAERFKLLVEEVAEPEQLFAEGELDIRRMDLDLIREIGLLEPFGNGNPEPLFLAKYLFVEEARTVGRQGEHIQLVLRKGKSTVRAIGFGLAGSLPARGDRVDVVGIPFIDSWQGRESPRIRIEDVRPAIPD